MTPLPPGSAEAAADVAGPARPLIVRVEWWSHGNVMPSTDGVYLANEADLAAFVRAVVRAELRDVMGCIFTEWRYIREYAKREPEPQDIGNAIHRMFAAAEVAAPARQDAQAPAPAGWTGVTPASMAAQLDAVFDVLCGINYPAEAAVCRAGAMVIRDLAKAPASPAAPAGDWLPTHRHYKGGMYRLLFAAIHTETDELMAVYDNADGQVFARPAIMFDGPVPGFGPRFAAIRDGGSAPASSPPKLHQEAMSASQPQAKARSAAEPAAPADDEGHAGDPGDTEEVPTAAQRHDAWVAAGMPHKDSTRAVPLTEPSAPAPSGVARKPTIEELEAILRDNSGDTPIDILPDGSIRARDDYDQNVERLKACEHIADGDEGWEKLAQLCPSTAAVTRLRTALTEARAEVARLKSALVESGKHLDEAQAELDKLQRAYVDRATAWDMRQKALADRTTQPAPAAAREAVLREARDWLVKRAESYGGSSGKAGLELEANNMLSALLGASSAPDALPDLLPGLRHAIAALNQWAGDDTDMDGRGFLREEITRLSGSRAEGQS